MAIGAGIGFFMVDDRPDLAALTGAVAGMMPVLVAAAPDYASCVTHDA